jgi:hypothetical protein
MAEWGLNAEGQGSKATVSQHPLLSLRAPHSKILSDKGFAVINMASEEMNQGTLNFQALRWIAGSGSISPCGKAVFWHQT